MLRCLEGGGAQQVSDQRVSHFVAPLPVMDDQSLRVHYFKSIKNRITSDGSRFHKAGLKLVRCFAEINNLIDNILKDALVGCDYRDKSKMIYSG